MYAVKLLTLENVFRNLEEAATHPGLTVTDVLARMKPVSMFSEGDNFRGYRTPIGVRDWEYVANNENGLSDATAQLSRDAINQLNDYRASQPGGVPYDALAAQYGNYLNQSYQKAVTSMLQSHPEIMNEYNTNPEFKAQFEQYYTAELANSAQTLLSSMELRQQQQATLSGGQLQQSRNGSDSALPRSPAETLTASPAETLTASPASSMAMVSPSSSPLVAPGSQAIPAVSSTVAASTSSELAENANYTGNRGYANEENTRNEYPSPETVPYTETPATLSSETVEPSSEEGYPPVSSLEYPPTIEGRTHLITVSLISQHIGSLLPMNIVHLLLPMNIVHLLRPLLIQLL